MSLNYDTPDEDYAATVAAAAYAVFSIEEAGEQNRRKTREYFLPTTKRITMDIKPGDAEITQFPRRSSNSTGDDSGATRRVSESEAMADAWEKAQLEKIRKRHEDMKLGILAWETEKKKEAKLMFHRRKQVLDYKEQINKQLYQNQITKIDGIARKAMTQAEEKRGDEESHVKKKLKNIHSGKSRLMSFCC